MSPLAIVAHGALATAALWAISGGLALLLGLAFAIGLDSRYATIRVASHALTDLGRCVPTSLYVLAAGMVAMQLPMWIHAPVVFVGTLPMFQTVALALCLALAFGSAGHVAVILRSSWQAVPREAREQFAILDLNPLDRARLVLRECAPTALPPLSARLVHHLHNTSFAALFPVADLFGAVQGAADTSARVLLFVALGAAAYLVFSLAIWGSLRVIEARLAPHLRRAAATRPS